MEETAQERLMRKIRDKHHTEFRPKGELEMYAPKRDVIYIYKDMLRAAFDQAYDQRPDLREDFELLGMAIYGGFVNDAIGGKLPLPDAKADLLGVLKDVNHDALALFCLFFTLTFMDVLFYGSRQSAQGSDAVSYEDLRKGFLLTNLLGSLDSDLRIRVKEEFRKTFDYPDHLDWKAMFEKSLD